MSKPGDQNQKPEPATDRGQTGQSAAESAVRAALEVPRKRDFCRVFVAVQARRARTLGQGLPPGPLSPGAYKYSLGSSRTGTYNILG